MTLLEAAAIFNKSNCIVGDNATIQLIANRFFVLFKNGIHWMCFNRDDGYSFAYKEIAFAAFLRHEFGFPDYTHDARPYIGPPLKRHLELTSVDLAAIDALSGDSAMIDAINDVLLGR